MTSISNYILGLNVNNILSKVTIVIAMYFIYMIVDGHYIMQVNDLFLVLITAALGIALSTYMVELLEDSRVEDTTGAVLRYEEDMQWMQDSMLFGVDVGDVTMYLEVEGEEMMAYEEHVFDPFLTTSN